MSQTGAQRYLAAALAHQSPETGCRTGFGVPFHEARNAYELCQSELAIAPAPPASTGPANSELAHVPIQLSELAWPRAYNYIVHAYNIAAGEQCPSPSWLLIYRSVDRQVRIMELQASTYTLLLALKLASQENCPVSATELLLELADVRETSNTVLFVEQGLKLLCRLNDMGLIVGVRMDGQLGGETCLHTP